VKCPGSVGTVERLISLEPEEFDSAPNSYDYAQSTLLVRYLCSSIPSSTTVSRPG